jgi:ubiquinone/menaquinone biosynthesis C-methylase UbiE
LSLIRLEPFRQWNVQYSQKGFDRANSFLSRVQRYFLLNGKKVLDLGCGQGYLSIEASKIAQEVVALDITDLALRDLKAKLHRSKVSKISLIRADATHLPFKPEVFDAALSYDLYEHVRDQHALLNEKFRVVKKNGCVAFSTGNKLFPMDRHTGLWFVDYLPQRIANLYVKIRKKRNLYNVYQPTYWSLKSRLGKQSSQYLLNGEYVLEMMKEVYPNTFRRFQGIAPLLKSATKVGIFKFLTPKFFVIALKT